MRIEVLAPVTHRLTGDLPAELGQTTGQERSDGLFVPGGRGNRQQFAGEVDRIEHAAIA